MNSTMKVGTGVVAACAACCAVSIVPALLAGTGLAALGAAVFPWEAAVAAGAVAAIVGTVFLSRRSEASKKRSSRNESSTSEPTALGCGCGSSNERTEAIACTLGADDLKARTAAIRDLAARSLLHAMRAPLSLTLRYDIAAAAEVRKLVAQERECCSFLIFSVRELGDVIEVAILASDSAAEAADALFDHFAPELACKFEVA